MPDHVSPPPAAGSPLAAFDGALAPNRTGVLYRAGLTLVAFAMVLLPIVYLALIGLAAWGVYYHLTHNTWILSKGSLFLSIAYATPAVAGFILIFFMIKPFFAVRESAPEPVTLDPEKEALLFAFVQKICDLVGAPMPSRVDVDCEVNASASLRRGMWSRELVLTIGLPLAAGLDMRQFAGVLAHEFGHFAQGAGMRLTYVIRRINAWFARVVFERDAWDVRLEQSAGAMPWQIGIVLHGARACVWATRRVLWALMHAGHAISCFMLRQMEYDADSYGAKLVGGDVFEATATRLRVLNLATHFAYEHVQQSWASRRLPENLVLLIERESGSLPGEVHQKMTAANPEEKTGWFDSHPSDADRLRAVRRSNERGIFHATEPAARLFSDFSALSKIITRHQYERHFKLAFADQDLMSADELQSERAAIAEAEALVSRYYGDVSIVLLPLLIDRQLPVTAEPVAALAEWRAACGEVEARREEAQEASAACVEQLQRRSNLVTAYHLAAAKFAFAPEDFGLSDDATTPSELRTAAEVALPDVAPAIDEQLTRLEPFFAALRKRIGLALALHAGSGAITPAAAQETAVVMPLLAAVGAEMKEALVMEARLRALAALARNRSNHADPADVDDEARKLASDLRDGIIGLRERLGSFTYPFADPRGQLTIADYLGAAQSTAHDWQGSLESGAAHVNRLFDLHHRLIGRALALADPAEKALDQNDPMKTGGALASG